MGAWGIKALENDRALDSLGEMSDLIEQYYTLYEDLVHSADEEDIVLAGLIYLFVISEDNKGEKDKLFAELGGENWDQELKDRVNLAICALSSADMVQYKEALLDALRPCSDNVNDWVEECKEDRRKLIDKMIELIIKG